MPIANQILASNGSYEPQRQNNWILFFPDLTAKLPGFDKWEFYLTLKSFPFPPESNAQKTIRYWNESRHYAGSVEDFGTQQLVLRDYVDKRSAMMMSAWRRLVWNPDTMTIGWASEYKVNGVLYLANGKTQLEDFANSSRTVFLQGCWPRQFNMSELDHDNDGDQVLINIELSIDRAFAGTPDGHADPAGLEPRVFVKPTAQGSAA